MSRSIGQGLDGMQLALDSGSARLPPTRCASTPSEPAVGASSVVEPWPQQTRYLGWRPLALENSSAMSVASSIWAMPQDWWANVPNVKSFPPVPILSDVTIMWSKGLCGNSAILNTPLRYSRQWQYTIAQQNYHAIWELLSIWKLPVPIPEWFCNPLDEG